MIMTMINNDHHHPINTWCVINGNTHNHPTRNYCPQVGNEQSETKKKGSFCTMWHRLNLPELEFKSGSSGLKDTPLWIASMLMKTIWQKSARSCRENIKVSFPEDQVSKKGKVSPRDLIKPNCIETWLQQHTAQWILSMSKHSFYSGDPHLPAQPCLTIFCPNSHLSQALKLAVYDTEYKAKRPFPLYWVKKKGPILPASKLCSGLDLVS